MLPSDDAKADAQTAVALMRSFGYELNSNLIHQWAQRKKVRRFPKEQGRRMFSMLDIWLCTINSATHLPRRICSIEGCNEVHIGKGFCRKHYQQWRAGVKQRNIADYSYTEMHEYLAEIFGAASYKNCAHCGERADHWAYDHTDPNEVRQGQTVFSLEPSRYLSLCASCHKKFDLAQEGKSVSR